MNEEINKTEDESNSGRVAGYAAKPIGRKSYGSIAHIPGSRLGEGEHHCSEGQARIATQQKRDKHDFIICQEKLDGSNVGVAMSNGRILPLTRAGYLANTSPYEQHHIYYNWVMKQEKRFREFLDEGERICAEWLALAHGTKYKLFHEPFVVFDIMIESERAILAELDERLPKFDFIQPRILSKGEPFSINEMLKAIETSGHGAIDKVEGAVWRVERNELLNKRTGGERANKVDFLCKYVRQDKEDGIYLPERSGKEPVWNWFETA